MTSLKRDNINILQQSCPSRDWQEPAGSSAAFAVFYVQRRSHWVNQANALFQKKKKKHLYYDLFQCLQMNNVGERFGKLHHYPEATSSKLLCFKILFKIAFNANVVYFQMKTGFLWKSTVS